MVTKGLELNLMTCTPVDSSLLTTIFDVILDRMREEYGITKKIEILIKGILLVVYYETDNETHMRFKKTIESTFKPGLFNFIDA